MSCVNKVMPNAEKIRQYLDNAITSTLKLLQRFVQINI
jgi:hypothetical protein